MNFDHSYNHHNAETEWTRRDLLEWVTDLVEVPEITVAPGSTRQIRQHVEVELSNAGWALNPRINPDYGLTISALSTDLAIQLQTGNMSRAPYDLLKLEYLFKKNRIKAAALLVPVKEAADILGSNIANAERVRNELELFKFIISVPILLVAFR